MDHDVNDGEGMRSGCYVLGEGFPAGFGFRIPPISLFLPRFATIPAYQPGNILGVCCIQQSDHGDGNQMMIEFPTNVLHHQEHPSSTAARVAAMEKQRHQHSPEDKILLLPCFGSHWRIRKVWLFDINSGRVEVLTFIGRNGQRRSCQ